MSIHADHNLYPGVNAHVNNYLQAVNRSRWRGFHSAYMTLLRIAIDKALPAGYIASEEESLQIDELDFGGGQQRGSTLADIQIYHGRQQRRDSSPSALAVAKPTLTLPLPTTLDPEDLLSGIVIYHTDEAALPGIPVVRIEILSPTNKQGGSHNTQYFARRMTMLKNSIRVVEIDFLHLSPSVVADLPSYGKSDQATPYAILLNDPEPSYDEGVMDVYGFGVLDEIPRIQIPLLNQDSVITDFSAVYMETIATSSMYQLIADYATDPPAFDRFTPQDQQALAAWLAEIRTHDANEEAS